MNHISLILERVAQEHNVSAQEVQKEIQMAIKAAMSNSDQSIQSEWASIPKKNEEPTPKELISFLLHKIISAP